MAADEPEAAAEPRETVHLWMEEANTPHYIMRMALKRIMFESKSKFQRVQVLETYQFGKTLILDGKTQSCLQDEYIYHESLVHPAMLLCPNPKRIYIGGGGEMATAREILRHHSVEKLTMVDIDEVVVDICRKELPEWDAGAFDDPRCEVFYEDAHAWLKNSDEKFDVIVMDIADPIEAGPGYVLYTQEFYAFAKEKLNPGGVLVTQSGPCSLYNYDECFTTIHKTLCSVFDHVLGYNADVPSFGSNWGFNLAFMDDGSDRKDFANWEPARIDTLVSRRISPLLPNKTRAPLRFYDGVSHRGQFSLPKPIRDAIEKEERIMTVDNPVFMF